MAQASAVVTFEVADPAEAAEVVKTWTLTPGATVVIQAMAVQQITTEENVILTFDPVLVPASGQVDQELDEEINKSHPQGLPPGRPQVEHHES
jgi:hypothetical protein